MIETFLQCDIFAGWIVDNLNNKGHVVMTSKQDVHRSNLVPSYAERGTTRHWIDVTELFIFQRIVDHHVSIHSRHGNLCVLIVPTYRVNDLLLRFSLG